MAERSLYLVAYDVADDNRLRAMLHLVRRYATGGQRSVHECFMTAAERAGLLADAALILDEDQDRFFVLRLDPRMHVRTLGIAVSPEDPPFFYVG